MKRGFILGAAGALALAADVAVLEHLDVIVVGPAPDHRPVAEAHVFVWPVGSQRYTHAEVTDVEGHASLRRVPVGPIELDVKTCPGFVHHVPLEVATTDEPIRVEMPTLGTLRVMLEQAGPNGKLSVVVPAKEAAIHVRRSDASRTTSPSVFHATTDAEGRFDLCLEPGVEFDFTFVVSGFVPVAKPRQAVGREDVITLPIRLFPKPEA